MAQQTPERTAPNVGRTIAVVFLLAIIVGLPAIIALDSAGNPAFLLVPIILLAWVATPAYIGSRMGRVRAVGARTGSLIGLLLGGFGLLVLLFFPITGDREKELQQSRRCPHCDERIRAAARICKHCRQPLEPVAIEPEFDD